ncbi:hypothetical protein J7K41_02070 [Candidatus Micrarchaeota archaeon]|nr:hypothetical protein [Candidatus Micrarchaeota archaeon]
MKRYSKGSRAERELTKMFIEHGFRVIRAAGSGNHDTPDILVFRKGKQYCFECKAWDRENLQIPRTQIDNLKKWEDITGITTMIAWRIPRLGWRFIPIHLLTENEKSYSINKRTALELFSFEDLIE